MKFYEIFSIFEMETKTKTMQATLVCLIEI